MPTTHVRPECEDLLQEIANSLWKSRKVVVVTGAGISTNSGIPVRFSKAREIRQRTKDANNTFRTFDLKMVSTP